MHASEEGYKEYQELKKYKLNNELIVHNVDCELIDDEVHNILLKENYIFSCMLTDKILNNICVIAVKRAPTNLLTFKSRSQHNSRNRGSVIHGPIDHIFSYKQNAIPNLLKAISDSGRDDLFIIIIKAMV